MNNIYLALKVQLTLIKSKKREPNLTSNMVFSIFQKIPLFSLGVTRNLNQKIILI